MNETSPTLSDTTDSFGAEPTRPDGGSDGRWLSADEIYEIYGRWWWCAFLVLMALWVFHRLLLKHVFMLPLGRGTQDNVVSWMGVLYAIGAGLIALWFA